jgi:hypothetical protein
MKKLSKVLMAGIAGLMLMSGPASGGPRELAVYSVVISEDILADLDSDSINVGRKNKENNIIFQDCDPACGVPFTLAAFWLQDDFYMFDNDGSECFPHNPGNDQESDQTGSIHLKVKKNGDAKATFWFTAKNNENDPNVDVQYQLILVDIDNGWDGDFPPAINNSAEMVGTGWELQTEGKGKFRHTACKGLGMNAEVKIVLTRIL